MFYPLIYTLLAIAGTTSAHSWVEEMQAISSNGSYTGDYGYTRGYVARTDPTFTGESMKYILPPLSSGRTRIDKTDLLCHPSQRTSSYSSTYPRLQVSPGTFISMKYLENGHVTLPATQPGKPASGGPVFIYATTSPSDTEKITDVLQWTSDSTGGDKRGSLIAANNYDDGRCHQLNSGAISTQRQAEFPDRVPDQPTSNVEQWCETDVKIPSSAKVGETLTLYWVWQWPTEAGVDPSLPAGKDEYYTSCAEVEVVAKVGEPSTMHTLVQQDPQSTAVTSFASRTALTTVPGLTLSGSASASTGSSYASSSGSSSGSSSVSATYSAPASTSTSSSSSNSQGGLPYITYSLSYLPTFVTSTVPASSGSSSTSAGPSRRFSSPAPGQSSTSSGGSSGDKTVTATVTDYVTMTAGSTPSPVTVGQAGLIGAKFRY